MARQPFHNQKIIPGDAYVTDTEKFANLVFETCIKLPKKWERFLLSPLFADADRIDTDVFKANRLNMNEKVLSTEELLKNLSARDSYLDDAILTFVSFDRHFDRLMRQFDIFDSDFKMSCALIKEIVEKADPDKKLNIVIHGSDRFFSYTADIDGQSVPVHFTRKKKDQILKAEALSKERIGDRRSKDRKYHSALCKKI